MSSQRERRAASSKPLGPPGGGRYWPGKRNWSRVAQPEIAGRPGCTGRCHDVSTRRRGRIHDRDGDASALSAGCDARVAWQPCAAAATAALAQR